MYNSYKKFSPKKPVHKFTDLEVYQQTLAISVIIAKDLVPKIREIEGKMGKVSASQQKGNLGSGEFNLGNGLTNGAISLPLWLAEAHSVRFADDHIAGLGLLEKVMSGCNKMVVYLEHAKGVYGVQLEGDLIDDLIKRYHEVRTKVFRLSKSWQKWYEPKK